MRKNISLLITAMQRRMMGKKEAEDGVDVA
jgi:hypothetical protein